MGSQSFKGMTFNLYIINLMIKVPCENFEVDSTNFL